MNSETKSPKVFISYSHDSEELKKSVLELADKLSTQEGIDCNIDQYCESPDGGLQRWIVNQIQSSDFVLIVCTKSYFENFNKSREESGGSGGKGVFFETQLIMAEIYNFKGASKKYIPILLDDKDSEFIHTVLKHCLYYCPNEPKSYEKLCRKLTNQHKTPKPPIGKIKLYSPSERPGIKNTKKGDSKLSGRLKASSLLGKLKQGMLYLLALPILITGVLFF